MIRHLLAVVAIAAALSVTLSSSQRRRPDGGVWDQPNRPPSAITEADVDTLMWPIVDRINRSGWVWTTESCQGHEAGSRGPESVRSGALLGLVTDDIGRLFTAIADAQALSFRDAGREHQDPHGFRLRVSFYAHPVVRLGRYQVRLMSDQLEIAREIFTDVARRVTTNESG